MKILIIPYNYPTRENPTRALFINDHKKMLEFAGNDVDVLGVIPKTITDVISSRSFYFGRLSDENWLISILAVKGMHKVNNWLFYKVGKYLLKKYLIKCSGGWPDIIHVHNSTSADLALWCSNEYGIPYVITEHSSAMWGYDAEKDQKDICRVYLKSKANIAVSEKFAAHLSNKFKCNFIYLPNPVDTEFFSSHYGDRVHDKIRLISVGNLTKNKNHQLAIKSVSSLIRQGLNIDYRIVGSGPELTSLKELVSKLKLQNIVTFEGSRSRVEVRDLLSNSDRFLLPSLAETFGVVLVEAMASGLPVMALKNGGSESIITNTNVGLLVSAQREFMLKLELFCIENYDSKYITSFANDTFSFSSISKKQMDIYQ